MPTGISCAKAPRSSRPSTARVTLPLRDGVSLTEGRLGRPRLVPAVDARTVPLDRHAALAGRKPPALDLPAGLAGPLLPAVAAAPNRRNATILQHVPLGESQHAALLRRGPERAVSSRCARSTRWRTPPCPQIEALGRQALAIHGRLRRLPAPRADRRPGRSDAVARRLAARTSKNTRSCRPTPGTAIEPHRRWRAPNRTNCGSAGASRAALKSSVDGQHVGDGAQPAARRSTATSRGRRCSSNAACTRSTLTYPQANLGPGSGWGRVHLPVGDRAGTHPAPAAGAARSRPRAGPAAVRQDARLDRDRPADRLETAPHPRIARRAGLLGGPIRPSAGVPGARST